MAAVTHSVMRKSGSIHAWRCVWLEGLSAAMYSMMSPVPWPSPWPAALGGKCQNASRENQKVKSVIMGGMGLRRWSICTRNIWPTSPPQAKTSSLPHSHSEKSLQHATFDAVDGAQAGCRLTLAARSRSAHARNWCKAAACPCWARGGSCPL